jgi:hypothetical protein
MKTLLGPLLLATLFASTSAFALTASDQYGSAAGSRFTGRTIVVDSHTHYVNVTRGETVTIRQGAASINWIFDGTRSVFELARIMPATATGQDVRVYVAPDMRSF